MGAVGEEPLPTSRRLSVYRGALQGHQCQGTRGQGHHRCGRPVRSYGSAGRAVRYPRRSGGEPGRDYRGECQRVWIPRSRVAIQVRLIEERGTAANIIGILPGSDPVLRETTLVVGAHYDHLGLGGEYSLAPSQYGEIHPGADDNASGTAALILLARAFAKSGGAKRTLIFAAFSAEEMGIVGSSHYTKHPRIPLEKTVAMINLDMIGRLKDRTLYVFGVKTGKEFADLLEKGNRDRNLILKFGGGGYGPSDHTSFYTRKIPVLFFFTGPHGDYHRPSDTADKIDADGLAEVSRFVYRIIEHLANRAEPGTYGRGEGAPGGGGRGGYGAYFGSIPDFGSPGGGGGWPARGAPRAAG